MLRAPFRCVSERSIFASPTNGSARITVQLCCERQAIRAPRRKSAIADRKRFDDRACIPRVGFERRPRDYDITTTMEAYWFFMTDV